MAAHVICAVVQKYQRPEEQRGRRTRPAGSQVQKGGEQIPTPDEPTETPRLWTRAGTASTGYPWHDEGGQSLSLQLPHGTPHLPEEKGEAEMITPGLGTRQGARGTIPQCHEERAAQVRERRREIYRERLEQEGEERRQQLRIRQDIQKRKYQATLTPAEQDERKQRQAEASRRYRAKLKNGPDVMSGQEASPAPLATASRRERNVQAARDYRARKKLQLQGQASGAMSLTTATTPGKQAPPIDEGPQAEAGLPGSRHDGSTEPPAKRSRGDLPTEGTDVVAHPHQETEEAAPSTRPTLGDRLRWRRHLLQGGAGMVACLACQQTSRSRKQAIATACSGWIDDLHERLRRLLRGGVARPGGPTDADWDDAFGRRLLQLEDEVPGRRPGPSRRLVQTGGAAGVARGRGAEAEARHNGDNHGVAAIATPAIAAARGRGAAAEARCKDARQDVATIATLANAAAGGRGAAAEAGCKDANP